MHPTRTIRPLLELISSAAERRLRVRMAAATLLVVAGAALSALSPLALKQLVDAATVAASGSAAAPTLLFWSGALYVAVLCGGRVVSDLRPLLTHAMEQQLVTAIRRRFLRHVLRLPLADLLHRRSGELLHSLDLGCAGTQLVMNHLMLSIAPVIVEVTTMTVVLAGLHQPAVVALFGATALLYLALFATGAIRLTRHAHAVTAQSLSVHGQLADNLANVETLRCFGGEAAAEQALADASASLMARWRHYHRASTGTSAAATALFALSLGLCLAITTQGIAAGSMSVGGLVLTNVYLLQMVRPLEILGSAARDVSRALGFVRPLLDILAEAAETAEPAPVLPAGGTLAAGPRRAPVVRLEGLTFGYETARPVIRALDLELGPGRTVAIVGPSGSGKSTLIRLLLRLYVPQSGRIFWDGRPIDTYPMREFRSLIALVPQNAALLHTSIAANIALGMPQAGMDAIIQASRAAQLHAFIESLPEGYETVVGDRGLKLSGGERQRVAIARALLRRPVLLVMDEPTSMLDSQTETEVLSALRSPAGGCTTLVVAHRLSTVMHADEIVVLDHGQVRERGRHAELLARGGLYARLWRSAGNPTGT